MRKITLASALVASTFLSAHSATIEYEDAADGLNVVSITGEIEHGNSDQFSQVVSALRGPTAVFLKSPGGLEIDGLNIGIAIHRVGYKTVVIDNTVCASVCGLIWLSGSPRILTPSSKIGFHAAYNNDGQESGKGNALVGAYLTKLGFSYDAVVYLLKQHPTTCNG